MDTTTRRTAFVAAALLCTAPLLVGGYFVVADKNPLAMASDEDCALAQKIIDSGAALPPDPAAAKAWATQVTAQRHAEMDSGLLSYQVSTYTDLAEKAATGNRPKPDTVAEITRKMNSHCWQDLKVTLPASP
jgi:hypothetical protein